MRLESNQWEGVGSGKVCREENAERKMKPSLIAAKSRGSFIVYDTYELRVGEQY
jgi:hypothetical protein